MKKFHKIILYFIALLLILPAMNSCRKGEEDPWFSFYSRKTRLCQDFKVTSFKRTEQINDSIVAFVFDGQSGTFQQISSNSTYVSPGTMRIIFSKTGSYTWDQEITTDTSNFQYAEKGFWYFTGGGKDSETKNKELLALQKNELTETFGTGGLVDALNYSGSGDLETNIYRIRKLASDQVILESEVRSTYVDLAGSRLILVTTEIILEPR